MAPDIPPLSFLLSIVCLSLTTRISHCTSYYDLPPLVPGLSWNFYQKSCPDAPSIVKKRIDYFLEQDVSQAAGLLHLHFHDCFVQGCDASVLLPGSKSEQNTIPNLTLRPQAFRIIADIKKNLEAKCPGVVSCADVLTLATRDAVKKAGGPSYPVPLGRRDSFSYASQGAVFSSLPPPFANVTGLLQCFWAKGLDLIDLVALSGAHTIGVAHCGAFFDRLSPRDPNLDATLAASLRQACPSENSTKEVHNDPNTPDKFDNKYFSNLKKKQGLFRSDEALFLDRRTSQIVRDFSINNALFFEQFGLSMIKLSQLSVLTGLQGHIRDVCSVASVGDAVEGSFESA